MILSSLVLFFAISLFHFVYPSLSSFSCFFSPSLLSLVSLGWHRARERSWESLWIGKDDISHHVWRSFTCVWFVEEIKNYFSLLSAEYFDFRWPPSRICTTMWGWSQSCCRFWWGSNPSHCISTTVCLLFPGTLSIRSNRSSTRVCGCSWRSEWQCPLRSSHWSHYESCQSFVDTVIRPIVCKWNRWRRNDVIPGEPLMCMLPFFILYLLSFSLWYWPYEVPSDLFVRISYDSTSSYFRWTRYSKTKTKPN